MDVETSCENGISVGLWTSRCLVVVIELAVALCGCCFPACLLACLYWKGRKEWLV